MDMVQVMPNDGEAFGKKVPGTLFLGPNPIAVQVRITTSGKRMIVSCCACKEDGDGVQVPSYELFPAIPDVPTIICCRGGLWWAGPGSKHWSPLGGQFTTETGEVEMTEAPKKLVRGVGTRGPRVSLNGEQVERVKGLLGKYTAVALGMKLGVSGHTVGRVVTGKCTRVGQEFVSRLDALTDTGEEAQVQIPGVS
jgi:hypothetical protein